jgi:hypothetical protein
MSIFHFYSLFTPVQAHFDQSTHQIGPSRSRDPVPGTKPRSRAGNRGGEKALPSLLPMAAGRIGPAALLLLLLGVSCPGARAGRTSEYRRKLGSAIDMPLDADVFRPPPGHNAPEQVTNPSYAQGTVSSFPGRRLRLVALVIARQREQGTGSTRAIRVSRLQHPRFRRVCILFVPVWLNFFFVKFLEDAIQLTGVNSTWTVLQ